jgi:hypothetical protein
MVARMPFTFQEISFIAAELSLHTGNKQSQWTHLF